MPHGILRMIARSTPVATVGLALTLAGPPVAGAQEPYTVAGSQVAIYNLVGRVTLEPGSGSDVTVDLVRGGADAGQLKIETGQIRDANTLRVIYPGNRVEASFLGSRQQTKLRVRNDGTFSDNRGDGGSRITISGDGGGLEAWADMTIRVPAGKMVSVYLAVGRVEAANVQGDLKLDTHSAPVTARGINGSLDIDAGSGSIDVTGVSGDLKIDTGSGGVRVDDVTGGEVDIDTGSGGVRGGGITATSIRIDTGSGGIDLDGVAADRLLLDTGSGGVRLTLTRVPHSVNIDTGSGGVTIRSPQGLNATVDLETGSGSIETDFPVTVRRHSRDHVQGTIGDGSGSITIETGSGSIRLVNTGG